MTLFAPNGLLGGPSTTETATTSTGGLFSMKPNGLLGTSSGTNNIEEDVEIPQEPQTTESKVPSFTLSSLLSKTKEKQVQAETNLDGSISTTQTESTSLSFTRTSLLGGFGTPSLLVEEFTPTSPSYSHTKFGQPSSLLDSSSGTNFDLPDPSSIRATAFNGKTICIRRRKRTIQPTEISSSSSSPYSDLLDIPIHRLLDNLSLAMVAELQAATDPTILNPDNDMDESLWVDRYRPSCFTDLIGNDRVGRETLAWVKQWDFCVFGKKKSKKRRRDDENFNADDEYHRPKEKILLISGPPGLGKTTLAHVVAQHAGYDVMEINASDARGGNVVEERIRPTLESGSLIHSTKPVLVVIDEIDGATGAGDNTSSFIYNLIQLAQSKLRKKKRPGQKQQKETQRPLLRPIICICNDINAPSLAKLKPYAYQVRFTRPANFHIVRRLQEICDTEGLKANAQGLSTLVAIAKGDLRGCINTLQFIKARKEEVTEPVIRKATVGMKEGDVSTLSALNDIFLPLTKKRVKELGLTEEQESRYSARLCYEIEASGKEAAIANGCFEHYATLRQHDANLSRFERATEWLISYDLLSSSMYVDGEFAILPYLPYNLVAFYPLFQARGSNRVERSHVDWEHLKLTKSNEAIYESLARCLHRVAGYRHLVSSPTLQLEFTPYINRIISPPLRPVNSQIIRPEERAVLQRSVDIMAALELRFLEERGEDGQLSYRLEPPIDVFITYDGKRASDIAVSRYAVRKLVATEIDTKLAARDVEAVDKGKRGKHSFGEQAKYSITDAVVDPSQPNQKRQKIKLQDIADKVPTDFFGRPIMITTKTTSKSAAEKQTAKPYRVSYKFHEGNSAAVRKFVKTDSFL